MPSNYDSYRYDPIPGLIMEQGRIAAEGAQRSGDIWANAIGNVGQQVGSAVQQYGEHKAVAKRDAGWLDYVNSGEWTQDPKAAYATSLKFWGPEKGPQQFQGLMATAHFLQGEKRDPKQDQTAAGSFIGALDNFTEEGRAKAYPQALDLVKKAFPDLPFSDQYDPKQWSDISALGKQLRGEKPPEGYTLKEGESRFGPDNKPLASVPRELPPPKPEAGFSLGPGEVRYDASGKVIANGPPRAPKEPAKPNWQQMEDANGNPILVDVATGTTKPFPEGVTPKAGAAEAGRIAGAKAALEASSEIKQYLSQPKVRNAIGPLIGRYNSLAQAAGVGDPVAVKLVGMLKSYAAMQPNIHGFRAVKFAGDIENLLTTKQDPGTLEAAISGIDTAALNVRDRGRHPTGAIAEGPKPIHNDAEFDALPSGTEFIAPDGSHRRKP